MVADPSGSGSVAPAAARRTPDRAAVVAAASRRYLAGMPLEMAVLAGELGIGRATLHRRVGNHQDLVGMVLAEQTALTFRSLPEPAAGQPIDQVCETLAAFVQAVVSSVPLQRLIDRDPVLFVRVVLGDGPVEECATGLVESVIRRHLGDDLATPPDLLARAIVRISDATMYAHLLSQGPARIDELMHLLRLVLEAAAAR